MVSSTPCGGVAGDVYLVEVSAEQGTEYGGGLHGEDNVPVDEGPVEEGVAPAHVEHKVGYGPTHDRDVGQRHCRVGGETCHTAAPQISACSSSSLELRLRLLIAD